MEGKWLLADPGYSRRYAAIFPQGLDGSNCRERMTMTRPVYPSSRSARRGVAILKLLVVLAVCAFLVALVLGALNNRYFWRTADQQGDVLFCDKKFVEAAKVYTDPLRIGVAQYRNGDFEAAAGTFSRVPGAVGAFNQGNAWLMRGKYEAAIASYQRALSVRPNWQEAQDNQALALARKKRLEDASKDASKEATEAYEPDKIVFDQKRNDQKGESTEMNEGKMSDEELRATWLRRVQTTPGDFLRAKFAYQASVKSTASAGEAKEVKE
jgi:Ca-activated chloride channel homolog